MLTARVVAWAARAPGGLAGLRDDLRAERARGTEVDDPVRPPAIDLGRWRRMSRLSRLATLVVGDVLDAVPGFDRDRAPLVHGTAMGEVVPSSTFLDRLFLEGPAAASPLNFQNSVYNATAAQVSLAFGLRGPAETVSTGMATGLAALARAAELLVRSPEVLLLVGDDLNPTTRTAYARSPVPPGEVVLAVRLARGEGLAVLDGEIHRPGDRFARGVALPYESDFAPVDGLRPEAAVGLGCANGLLALLACPGSSAVDRDGDGALTGWSLAVPEPSGAR